MSGNEILGAAEQAKQENRMGNSFVRRRRWALPLRLIPRNWALVEEDCRRTIHLDSTIFKAHHMLGVALQRRREYVEGIRELEKALDLARSIYPNFDMVKRIQCDLARGKYS